MQSLINEKHEVTVTDIKMPFWSMVAFMIKWTIASIPAMILLAAAAFGFVFLATVLLGMLGIGLHGLTR